MSTVRSWCNLDKCVKGTAGLWCCLPGEEVGPYSGPVLGDVFIILYHPFGTQKNEESVFFTLSAWRSQCCALVIEQVSHLSTVPPRIINIEHTGARLRFRGVMRRGGHGEEKKERE